MSAINQSKSNINEKDDRFMQGSSKFHKLILLYFCCSIPYIFCGSTSVECLDTVEIPNVQYNIINIYNTTDTTTSILQAILGSSGAIYYAALVGSSTVVFSKEDTSQTIVWAKSYSPHYFFQKGFTILPDESAVYSVEDGSRTYVKILKINATDGSLMVRYQNNGFTTYSSANMEPFLIVTNGDSNCDSSSSTGCSLYYTAVDSSTNAVICKFAVSGTTSSCAVVPSSNEVTSFLHVDSTHIFFTLRDKLATFSSPAFVMHQWGLTAPVWAKNRACPDNGCPMFQGSAILSSDKAKIYSLLSHNQFQTAFLQVFDKSSGATVGTRYQTSEQGFLRSLDLQLHSTSLYCLVEYQYAQLFIYDTAGDTWTHSLRFQTQTGSLLQNNQASLTYLYGQINSSGYKVGFYLELINSITSVSESPKTMEPITSGYTMSDSSLVVQAPSDITLMTSTSTDAPETVETVEYIVNNETSWQDNIHVNDTDQLVEEIEPDTEISFDANCTCTTTPERTNITYTIKADGDQEVPDWVTLNVTSGKYEGTAPSNNVTTNYTFVLNSTWVTDPAGSSEQKVTFSVEAVPKEPEPEEPSAPEVPPPPGAVVASTAGAVAGAGVSVVQSMLSGSPPTAFYSILHQLQIFNNIYHSLINSEQYVLFFIFS